MTRRKSSDNPVRLQKFLSDAGVASRRHAEEMIEAGRVLVNDVVVDRLPAFVNPAADRVVVDGAPVRQKSPEYFIVHKPKGVVCTNRDPAGRLRAVDLLPPTRATLNVVGRLDAESTGLLLMTNDGELAEQITHPRLELPKVYRVEVRGQVAPDIVARLRKGVHLAEGKATASDVEVVRRSRESSVLRITLREGRNRQIRRMLARQDHPVRALKRIEIGPLRQGTAGGRVPTTHFPRAQRAAPRRPGCEVATRARRQTAHSEQRARQPGP
jgi:23S rRNA pseudouridine2605 synthase